MVVAHRTFSARLRFFLFLLFLFSGADYDLGLLVFLIPFWLLLGHYFVGLRLCCLRRHDMDCALGGILGHKMDSFGSIANRIHGSTIPFLLLVVYCEVH